MQTQFAPPRTGKAALRIGLSLGILLGIIHSAIIIVNTVQSANQLGNVTASSVLFYLSTPLIWIVGLLVAGIWASKITGKVSTGTLAGLFTGLFGGLVAGFGQAIASTLSVTYSQLPSYSANLVLFTSFATIFYILVLAIGAGAGCGALGGLIGQTVSDVRPPVTAQPHPIPPTPVYQPPVVAYGYMPQQQPVPQTPQPRTQDPVVKLPEQ